MASKLFIVCILLPSVLAMINIFVTAPSNELDSDIKVYGANVDFISDKERMSFQVYDELLKDAVLESAGRRPDNVYLRDPTPLGYMYYHYGWEQVTTTLSPQSVKLSVISQLSGVSTQIIENISSKTVEYKAMVAQLNSTLTSAWKTKGELGNIPIRYGFDINASSVSGDTDLVFSYDSNWGQNVSKWKKVTVGTESGVTVNLEPNQKVVAEVYVKNVTMKIELGYKAWLKGAVVVDYSETYQGHHFWWLDVNETMTSAGLENSVLSSEVITINYYTDGKLVVKDPSTNDTLYSSPLSLYYWI